MQACFFSELHYILPRNQRDQKKSVQTSLNFKLLQKTEPISKNFNFLIFAGFERIIDIPACWRETSQYVATLAHKVIFIIFRMIEIGVVKRK